MAQLRVMISSTARDLPDHREQVMKACHRMEMFYADMMENLTATDANALEISLQMVDKAQLYIGVFGYRYGYVPEGESISITEAEYNRAVKREIPRLIFLMSDEHAVKPSDVETGPGAEKLVGFKKRLEKERVIGYFDSPDDLRGQVIQALVPFRETDITKLHPDADVPSIAETYIAHPYTLLQTYGLIGRQNELNLLTQWVADPYSNIYKTRILSVVAIGGMGKSALTWKWFNEIAPQEMKPLAGRMWWSFYESDARYENFIIRALAYVSDKSVEEVQKISEQDREFQLLEILDREPFLIVLDGLERILNAYARMDAAHLSDNDYDRMTANVVANAYGLPQSATDSYIGQHRLRKTSDPRAGAFLRKLSNVRAARILISTRLYPADLQMVTGEAIGNAAAVFLQGLSDDDALNLWRAYKVSGSSESLLPLFDRIERHPLLIQSLAGEVSRDRENPGDFDGWLKDHRDFDPFSLPAVQVKSHVLEFALRGLSEKSRQVLHTIAAFRMPGQYDTLSALMVGEGKPCAEARELDVVLTELEDRGLVGWDKRANRYDLHPIVRGVVWSGLGDVARQGVYTSLHAHFEAVPMVENYLEVNSLEDLTPAIELYSTLIGLERYDDAYFVFKDRLDQATLYRLSASRQRVELLEMLFPDGSDKMPLLSEKRSQAVTFNELAAGYRFSGQPGTAVNLLRRATLIDLEMDNDLGLCIRMGNLSDAFRLTGKLWESEESARRALVLARKGKDHFWEAYSLFELGLTLAARGETDGSELAMRRSLDMFIEQEHSSGQSVVNYFLAQRAIWFGEYAKAASFAARAWNLAHVDKYKADFIRAARVQGEAALGGDDFETADERLHHALTPARAVNHVEEELPVLIALAELRRRQGDEKAAREFLDDVWEFAERGPYPPFQADALNVLAQIERDAGNKREAIEAATRAYQLAWCGGPPYAYHSGLIKAQIHLEELGAPIPDMPPFDESKFEPMPELEIDPDDEFHVGDE